MPRQSRQLLVSWLALGLRVLPTPSRPVDGPLAHLLAGWLGLDLETNT